MHRCTITPQLAKINISFEIFLIPQTPLKRAGPLKKHKKKHCFQRPLRRTKTVTSLNFTFLVFQPIVACLHIFAQHHGLALKATKDGNFGKGYLQESVYVRLHVIIQTVGYDVFTGISKDPFKLAQGQLQTGQYV